MTLRVEMAIDPRAAGARPSIIVTRSGDVLRLSEGLAADSIAATAEELARRYSVQCPEWTTGKGRALHRPWFASDLASLRAVLLLESPAPFRARNLFVSENALSRV